MEEENQVGDEVGLSRGRIYICQNATETRGSAFGKTRLRHRRVDYAGWGLVSVPRRPSGKVRPVGGDWPMSATNWWRN